MNKRALLVFGIALVVAFLIFSYLRRDEPRLQYVTGQTMGTITYNVKYIGSAHEDLEADIYAELEAFNRSLSTYISDSEISRFNKEGRLIFESKFFYPVLQKSQEVFENTQGSFDPTVGPLVMAWGFGPNKKLPELDSGTVDSLKSIVGFDQVIFDTLQVSAPKNFQLDFSAIAKGYAVDLVATILEDRGVKDYLVEIGGEVRCSGMNEENKSWSLGIEDPLVEKNEQRILAIVRMKNRSLATSGNYRNYYEKEGRTYAHIIDPRTGYNAKHRLLSASVFADDCMTADAYATAFMVLGLDASKRIIEASNIEGILFYQAPDGALNSYVSDGIQPFVELNKAK